MASYIGIVWDTRMSTYVDKWVGECSLAIDINEFFFTLRNLLERKSNLHWHSCYLQKYINDNMCPFGLRIQLFPHFKISSEEFKTKWEQTNCSLSLIVIVIDHYKNELSGAGEEIKTLWKNAVHLQAVHIQHMLYIYRNDFTVGRAYRWSNSSFRKQGTVMNNMENVFTNDGMVSDSSSASSSFTSNAPRTKRTHKQTRKRLFHEN